jgi:Peptidase family S41
MWIGKVIARLLPWVLALNVALAHAQRLEVSEQMQIIRSAADLIEARYVDAKAGMEIAATLRNSVQRWKAPSDPEAFAKEVTSFMQAASGDGHLGLSYSPRPLPEGPGVSEFTAAEMNRWYGPQINHGVERIERFPDNISLLELRVFPPPDMAGDVLAAAMTVVAQGDALILDLRKNGGGAETANLLLGYLLPPGSPLSGTYDRPSNKHTYISSPAWVPGRRFGPTKPLYVLTSSETFSAAEAVAYDLQALRRAVIVGETSGGGAHPFDYRRIHQHFAVDLPEGKSINPITGSNWQGVGVKPDVAVPADQALSTALALAKSVLKASSK